MSELEDQQQAPSLIFGTYERDESDGFLGAKTTDFSTAGSGHQSGNDSSALSTTPLLSTLLIGEEEQPVMGMLGFGVVTFGTATCIFCILANSIVLIDIRREILSSSISHRTHHLFHVTQTIIDFLLGILIMPIHVLLDSHMAGDWLFNTPLCRVWYAFDVALCTAAIWNQYISCLDKYWCVTSPLTYVGKRRRSRIKQMFRILGLLAFGIGSPVLFDCNLADNAIYAFYSTLGSFWVPMVTLITLSIRSYRFRRGLVKIHKEARAFISPFVLAKALFDMLHPTRLRVTNPVNNNRPPIITMNDKEYDLSTTEAVWKKLSSTQLPPSPRISASESMPSFDVSRRKKRPSHHRKKPVNMCVRHYNARDNGPNISAIRHAMTPPELQSPELNIINEVQFVQDSNTTPSVAVNKLSPTDYYNDELSASYNSRHRQQSQFSLKSLIATSPLYEDQYWSSYGTLSNSQSNTTNLTADFVGKCRRVRFNVEKPSNLLLSPNNSVFNCARLQTPSSPASYDNRKRSPTPVTLKVNGDLRNPHAYLNGVIDAGKEQNSLSSLSPKNGHCQSGVSKMTVSVAATSNGTIRQKCYSAGPHTPNGTLITDESIVENGVVVENSKTPRHHSSISSLNYQPADEGDSDDGSNSKLIFFNRLRTFVSSALSRDVDEGQLPFDVYWRQCNVNEHFIYSTAIVLSVCWGPFFLMYAIGLFFKIESSHKAIRLLLWFGYFNSALNPALIPILTRLYE